MPLTIPPPDDFVRRHIGPSPEDMEAMLDSLGLSSLEDLVERAVPERIRAAAPAALPPAADERHAALLLSGMASDNEVWRSYIGMGYHGTITPPVIRRRVIENPGWYTAYTPYQAEISQGRLEALLLYQTMIEDLTGFPISNASMLDEATAAAEAMTMSKRLLRKNQSDVFFVSELCHPQTIAVVQTRARPLGIEVVVGDHKSYEGELFGALVQYPASDGAIHDYSDFCAKVHDKGGLVTMATDLLALVLMKPPAEVGADIAIGNAQRFGVPMGYGGPHAAFMATHDDYKRQIPGRIIGVSHDAHHNPAYRMSLQTREQHIRREKATSNICTSQVLLAVAAGMYAVWHGPAGLKRIAQRVHAQTSTLARGLQRAGYDIGTEIFFDTLRVRVGDRRAAVLEAAQRSRFNLRLYDNGDLGVALDETVQDTDLDELLQIFGCSDTTASLAAVTGVGLCEFDRTSPFLTHPAFSAYHSETAMLRYLHRLALKDLALDVAMIPLGSCTMKLNAATEMEPITLPGFAAMHPFAPPEQAAGYRRLFDQLQAWLAAITGFAAVSLQPNAGSQGEYTGLLTIRAFHEHKGQSHRNICLIPTSAHGTNPASAVMAGMEVVAVACDDNGNIDVGDLRTKAEQHAEQLAALMVTYPSTHGVFEEAIVDICRIVHEHGGQVYMDGANMNAMIGIARPGEFGADVLHLNLHKTFAIPHGGGGPGMGPIACAAHLAPFLPGHPVVRVGGEDPLGTVSAAPWGSASILPISWAYIAMCGAAGLRKSAQVAILNANYVARRLDEHYPVLYKGKNGLVAHECILDLRPLKATSGIGAEDVAKRLMDYGFHAPTMSFPVAGTLMVEPTESEPIEELDRFCEAMIAIREEIRAVQEGRWPVEDNPLVNAPHTAGHVMGTAWAHPYSREEAAFPSKAQRVHKYWPTVGRIDNAYGDRNLVCACPPWGEDNL